MTDTIADHNKVLIICYYWPPAGGPGVQRWLKFVKYLPEFGIVPHVYIPENPSYPIVDTQLYTEVNKDIVIIKKKIFEPYQIGSFFFGKKINKLSSGIIPKYEKQSFFEKLILKIRGNLFVPDARIFWVRPSVTLLSKYIKENNITTVITTGPPHSLHLIGYILKQKFDIKWIADFRDPWTTIGYHKSLKLLDFAVQKHKNLEHKILNSADQIIVTSPTTKLEFATITTKPIEVITNGFDNIENFDAPETDKAFSIAHIGSLLSDRNPVFLWEIFSELKSEIATFSTDFQLKLIGKISEDVLDSIAHFGLNDNLNNLGYLSHNEAIIEQRKSVVLLLIEINSEDTKAIIPGKLFEYLVSKRAIIAVGPKGSDIKSIIENTQTGIFADYTEKDIVKSYITLLYEQFKTNSITIQPLNVAQYSRRNLTMNLAKLIRGIASK